MSTKTSATKKPRSRAASKEKLNQKQIVSKVERKVEKKIAKKAPGHKPSAYLKTLIDPEHCHGVRYPDSLPKATGVFRGLINHNAYYFGNDTAQTVEPPGTYFNVLTPTLINPLLEYRLDPVTSGVQLSGLVSTADDSVGLFPLTEDIADPATGMDQMYIVPAATRNMKCFWVWSDQDFGMPPLRGETPDGDVYYGVPVTFRTDGGGVDDSFITVSVTTVDAATSTSNPFRVSAVTNKGTYEMTTDAAVIGRNTYTYTVRATQLAPLLLDGHGLDRAGKGMPGLGFRIKNNSTVPQVISGYHIRMIINPGSTSGAVEYEPRFTGVSLPDELTYAQTIDQYRVVSMSHWLEYNGSDLKNGGQCAALLYRGGQSALENGLFDYQSVSEAPESYAGSLKHGTYAIWAPNSDNDMLMRNLSPHERWQFPYIVNSGVVAEPDQINALRSRIPINYEIVSTAQFYDFEKPVPDPEAIEIASLALRHYPCAMANGVHLKWIKDVISKVGNFGSNAAKWAVENKSWLIPAASAIGATLL